MLATAAGNLPSAKALVAAGADPYMYGSSAFEVSLLMGRPAFAALYWSRLPPRNRWCSTTLSNYILSALRAPVILPFSNLNCYISVIRGFGYEVIFRWLDFFSFFFFMRKPGPRAASMGPWSPAIVGLVAPGWGAAEEYIRQMALLSSPGILFEGSQELQALSMLVCFAGMLLLQALLRLALSVPLRRVLWTRQRGRVWQLVHSSTAWLVLVGPRTDG
jgi:hypothetical protein